VPSNPELTQRLEDAGLEVMAYERRFKFYKIRLDEKELAENIDLIREIISMAYSPEDD
jgi:hypothetical protein